MSAIFGVLGVVLACMGLYATVAFSVASRTRENGIRLAVGAGVRRVTWMVLRESLSITALGVLIGLPAAMAGARLDPAQTLRCD